MNSVALPMLKVACEKPPLCPPPPLPSPNPARLQVVTNFVYRFWRNRPSRPTLRSQSWVLSAAGGRRKRKAQNRTRTCAEKRAIGCDTVREGVKQQHNMKTFFRIRKNASHCHNPHPQLLPLCSDVVFPSAVPPLVRLTAYEVQKAFDGEVSAKFAFEAAHSYIPVLEPSAYPVFNPPAEGGSYNNCNIQHRCMDCKMVFHQRKSKHEVDVGLHFSNDNFKAEAISPENRYILTDWMEKVDLRSEWTKGQTCYGFSIHPGVKQHLLAINMLDRWCNVRMGQLARQSPYNHVFQNFKVHCPFSANVDRSFKGHAVTGAAWKGACKTRQKETDQGVVDDCLSDSNKVHVEEHQQKLMVRNIDSPAFCCWFDWLEEDDVAHIKPKELHPAACTCLWVASKVASATCLTTLELSRLCSYDAMREAREQLVNELFLDSLLVGGTRLTACCTIEMLLSSAGKFFAWHWWVNGALAGTFAEGTVLRVTQTAGLIVRGVTGRRRTCQILCIITQSERHTLH